MFRIKGCCNLCLWLSVCFHSWNLHHLLFLNFHFHHLCQYFQNFHFYHLLLNLRGLFLSINFRIVIFKLNWQLLIPYHIIFYDLFLNFSLFRPFKQLCLHNCYIYSLLAHHLRLNQTLLNQDPIIRSYILAFKYHIHIYHKQKSVFHHSTLTSS